MMHAMVDVDSSVLALAHRVADAIAGVAGVRAVALGGSHARGAAAPNSDVDLGIYYALAAPLDVAALREIARRLEGERATPGIVTELGAWGAWVNGGAWLEIDGVRVDWLYREIGRVERVVEECIAGRPSVDYALGHPHGHHSHTLLAELHYALPLVDADGELARLKTLGRNYPPRLRDALITRFLFDAQFMLECARKTAGRGDVFQAVGCFFRCVAALVQVLFARNERFFLNEKGAVAEIEAMPVRPERFAARVAEALGHAGVSPPSLRRSFDSLTRLVADTSALCARSVSTGSA